MMLSRFSGAVHEIIPPNNKGYVYVLKEVNGIHYKIGRTIDPIKRQKTFAVNLPFKVKYTYVIQCEDMYAFERQLHWIFRDKRAGGEWFELDADDLDAIVYRATFQIGVYLPLEYAISTSNLAGESFKYDGDDDE